MYYTLVLNMNPSEVKTEVNVKQELFPVPGSMVGITGLFNDEARSFELLWA